MGKDRNQTAEAANGAAPSGHGHPTSKSNYESEPDPDPDSDSDSNLDLDLDEGSRKSEARRKRSRSRESRTRTSGSNRKRSRDSNSCTSSSDYDSELESESDYSSDSEEERRCRRKERKKEKQRKEKKMRKRRRGKEEDKGKKGALTNSWGKYGIVKETDMWNKRPEFIAWLVEVKQVNLKSLPDWEEKQLFKDFMEDHNTATFPSKKYYDLDAYYLAKTKKEEKRGYSKVQDTERTVFDYEELRGARTSDRTGNTEGRTRGSIKGFHVKWNGIVYSKILLALHVTAYLKHMDHLLRRIFNFRMCDCRSPLAHPSTVVRPMRQ